MSKYPIPNQTPAIMGTMGLTDWEEAQPSQKRAMTILGVETVSTQFLSTIKLNIVRHT